MLKNYADYRDRVEIMIVTEAVQRWIAAAVI